MKESHRQVKLYIVSQFLRYNENERATIKTASNRI